MQLGQHIWCLSKSGNVTIHQRIKDVVRLTVNISHHPPVTAYCIWNDQHGVQVSSLTLDHCYHEIILSIQLSSSYKVIMPRKPPFHARSMSNRSATPYFI